MATRKGFTLIELLVVISIIGMLSAIVLASLNSARAKARDAVRKSDLHTIQTALELYYSTCGSYIVRAGSCAGTPYGWEGYGWFNYDYSGYSGSVAKGLKDYGLLPKEVADPTGATSGATAYMIRTDGSRYTLWATLENPSGTDTATLSTCYFSDYDNYSGAGTQNYCLSN